METTLKLINPEKTIDFRTIHPVLSESAAILEVDGPAGEYDTTHSVTFTQALHADEIVDILSSPVQQFVGAFDERDVRGGLQKLIYPNSRLMRNGRQMGPEAVRAILDNRRQIRGLMDVITNSEHHEMVPVKLRTLDPTFVDLIAWEEIGGMKPTDIKRRAESYGITYDQLKVWRLKGGDRHNRAASVSEMGLEDTSFVDQFIAEAYVPKTAVPGASEVLVPADDLPPLSWAREPGYIELLRKLPAHVPDELGQRWEALLRREDVPVHVVRPKLQWRTEVRNYAFKWIDKTAEFHRQIRTWDAPYAQFVHESTAPIYNPIQHTVEHTSTFLGQALLAANIESSAIRRTFDKLHQGKHFRYVDGQRFPTPRMSGALPLILQDPFLVYHAMDSEAFRSLNSMLVQSFIEA